MATTAKTTAKVITKKVSVNKNTTKKVARKKAVVVYTAPTQALKDSLDTTTVAKKKAFLSSRTLGVTEKSYEGQFVLSNLHDIIKEKLGGKGKKHLARIEALQGRYEALLALKLKSVKECNEVGKDVEALSQEVIEYLSTEKIVGIVGIKVISLIRKRAKVSAADLKSRNGIA